MYQLVLIVAATVFALLAGLAGYNYPNGRYSLLFLCIFIAAWVLSICFVALTHLNKDADEAEYEPKRG
jgi:hypothetical protein